MSIETLRHVGCDVCGRPSHEGHDTTREALAEAKRRGWARHAGLDICPNCQRAGWVAKATWPDGHPHKLRRIAP